MNATLTLIDYVPLEAPALYDPKVPFREVRVTLDDEGVEIRTGDVETRALPQAWRRCYVWRSKPGAELNMQEVAGYFRHETYTVWNKIIELFQRVKEGEQAFRRLTEERV